jgi:hypothetical protein
MIDAAPRHPRPGEVVRSINGQSLNYADDIRRVYQQLGNAKQAKVELVRDGKMESLHYRVVEGENGPPPRNRRPQRRDTDWGNHSRDAAPADVVPVEPPHVGGNEAGDQPSNSAAF